MKFFDHSVAALALVASFAGASSAMAGPILTFNPANESDKATGLPLAASATENVTGTNKTLALLGEGVRIKEVVGWSNIYLAEFFAEKPAQFDRNKDKVMASLDQTGMMALRMTFTYFLVPVGKIVGAFNDSLNMNMSDADQATYGDAKQAFLNAVTSGGGGHKGKSITIFGMKKADGTEEIIFEDQNGNDTTIDTKAQGFVKKIFSIWFGAIDPSDKGLIQLKDKLLIDPKVTPKH